MQLRQKMRDVVSGLEGIATAKVTFLNGCVRYALQPPVGEDGKLPDSCYVDVEQLEVVGPGVVKEVVPSPTSGDARNPVRQANPTRGALPRS